MTRPISVDLFTSTHRISGQIVPGTQGLFSYLNLPTESYIEIEEGEISPLHQITQPPETFFQLWLVKSEIVAVLVETRGGLGPSSTVRAGYTRPFPHWVRIIASGYEIRGSLQSGARFDFAALMFEGNSNFMPLYDAKLSAILFPRVQAEAPAMVFNRTMVHAINLLPGDDVSESQAS
jgi:hypothetical protein